MKQFRILIFIFSLISLGELQANTLQKDPLYFLDGKAISKVEMNNLDPKSISSVNVLKGKQAKEKYGKQGKQGVIEITSKK